MKRFAVAFSIFLFSLYGFADTIVLGQNGEPSGLTIVSDELQSRTDQKIVVKCNISELEKSTVSTPKGMFTRITLPMYQAVNDPGNPWLPMMHHLIEVPFGAKLEIQVISKIEKEYLLSELGIEYPVMPCQPSHRKDEREFRFVHNEETYQKDEYLEYPLARIMEVGMLRHYRVAAVQIAPVLYNPVQKKLKVYNEIYLEISMRGSDLERTREIKKEYYSPYFDWVEEKLLIPNSLKAMRPPTMPVPVSYAIVADRAFEAELAPFIETKLVKGYCVTVAYTDKIGKTLAEIQKYLHDLYKNPTPETPAPTFVLLVGDIEQIPAFQATSGYFVTDLYYVAVTEDKLPDMYCGRFSAKTREDVLAQVEKSLEYEHYRLPDPTFLKAAVMIAGWDYSHAVEWGYPQINYGAQYYFNEAHGIDSVHKFLSSASHQNEKQIKDLINQGVGLVNYTAHGSSTSWSDPSFTKAEIDAVGNANRYSLLIGNCCLTNKFDVDVCFGEAWLRVKGKGAIGYIGGSSYTYWDEDLWWGVGYYNIAHPNENGLPPKKEETKDGAYDGAFETGFFTNAGIMMAGNLAVEDSTSSLKVYYWEVYHLMGDPSLMVYWGIPKPMPVKHPAELKITATAITVEAEEGAYVGITMDGKLHGVEAIGTTGKAEIKIKPFPKSGTAAITVTRQNREPYMQAIRIVE